MKSKNSKSKWFFELFGFIEDSKSVYKNIRCENLNNNIIIHSLINDKKFNSGIFSLRDISSFKNLTPKGNGKIHLIEGRGTSSTKQELIDVLKSQSLPENNGSTYLAASNFNCLEFCHHGQTASLGITDYYLDITQGPYCALATGPSLLYRNYFVPIDDKNIGQLNKEINLLERTPIKIQHGYALIDSKNESKLKNINWDDLNLFQVGIHQNCQVTMSRNKSNDFKIFYDSNQIVHHVYAAAFNYVNDVSPTPLNYKIGEKLLEAEYKLAVLSAWENSLLFPNLLGSNKLYLTLLGGGVFRNPKEMIINSLIKFLDLIIESGLDVYIICYTESSTKQIKPLISKYVETTGGSFILT